MVMDLSVPDIGYEYWITFLLYYKVFDNSIANFN